MKQDCRVTVSAAFHWTVARVFVLLVLRSSDFSLKGHNDNQVQVQTVSFHLRPFSSTPDEPFGTHVASCTRSLVHLGVAFWQSSGLVFDVTSPRLKSALFAVEGNVHCCIVGKQKVVLEMRWENGKITNT